MTNTGIDLMTVRAKARAAFGDGAEAWLRRANRQLDGMTPLEMAQSPEGVEVVLSVLAQQSRHLPPPAMKTPSEASATSQGQENVKREHSKA